MTSVGPNPVLSLRWKNGSRLASGVGIYSWTQRSPDVIKLISARNPDICGPLMDNPGYSQSANTQYFFADLDGSGAADKVYWNYGASDGPIGEVSG